MSKTRGRREGFSHDSVNMPTEQKESNKQKIAKIHDVFPDATKDHISKILLYYDDDESKVIDAITRDGGREALSSWAESSSLKNKNKNKKKKRKAKKDTNTGLSATASFDGDDSSSLHSGGNVEVDIEKDIQRLDIENGSIVNEKTGLESLSNHERVTGSIVENNDISSKDSIPKAELATSSEIKPFTSSEESSVNVQTSIDCDKSNTDSATRSSPLSDVSDKQIDQGIKREKYRPINESYQKHSSRQRTSSFRRSKSSSISEESSSQNNSQATAAPTKRGFDKCKKDLNRQNISLQRIQTQLEKGFEDSMKKAKNLFMEVQKQLENRRMEIDTQLEKRKSEAFQLLKSRQDLAIELKRRVDRTPSLTEAEWTELRSDIKQFVTERKYDDDLGKTIWFQWTDISETIQTYGEVPPVKNVYSQRSHSVPGSSSVSNYTNAEPSPSSSLTNEENEASVVNDVGIISDTVEEVQVAGKEETPAFTKIQPSENRTRVYSNKRYDHRYNNQNRFPDSRGGGGYRGNRGGYQQRPPYRNNNNAPYNNKQHAFHNSHDDYKGPPPHADRGGRPHNSAYNNNYQWDGGKMQHRGGNNNYNNRFTRPHRGPPRYHNNNNENPTAGPPPSNVKPEKSNVVNGHVCEP